jgi:2-keto-4-pentenoate hydratase/2-oxohepta-3-ene-1,7-dioic acid hydratase in catechol pathway
MPRSEQLVDPRAIAPLDQRTRVKLAAFTVENRRSFGLVTEAGVVDLGQRLKGKFSSLEDLIAQDALAQAAAHATTPADYALSDIVLEKPLANWGKCFCVGINYLDRSAEYKDGASAPAYPSLFVRFAESFVGPGADILRPKESIELDYEGEIALVIGKRGRRIASHAWRDHVFGFTLANEGTIRDWVRHGKFNVTPGKNWAKSGALGPWIVTTDALPEQPLRLVTRVNGEERQNETTERMIFSFGRIIEYISTFCTLEPGDLIITGTPTGAGARFDPPRWLKPGDVIEVEVAGLGLLRNPIADELAQDLA